MLKIVTTKDGTRWLVADTAEWPNADDEIGFRPHRSISYAEAIEHWRRAFEKIEKMLLESRRVQ
jgi:hypothetical protein